ncbi:FRG domain-containing protein [Vibrio vulnificus]|uniref:FRG domain-containing protein n=1 Tax=Vibrio vulnificus TaxID=672 RepID=UPI003ED89544
MSSDSFEVIRIESLDEFKDIVDSKAYRKWIYRGQSDHSWLLESSFLRSIGDASKVRKAAGEFSTVRKPRNYEEVMIERFKSGAHLFLDHLPKNHDVLSWLAVMQHHGAPTRLLDFSFSPYIALYFALESGCEDAAIYCVDHASMKRVDDQMFGENRSEMYEKVMYGEDHNHDMCLFAFEPEFANQRLLAQQGLFVIPNHLAHSHEVILREYNMSKRSVHKLVIPKELRFEGLRMLHQMNITSSTIYPGLDGFCKNLHKLPVFPYRYQTRVGKES